MRGASEWFNSDMWTRIRSVIAVGASCSLDTAPGTPLQNLWSAICFTTSPWPFTAHSGPIIMAKTHARTSSRKRLILVWILSEAVSKNSHIESSGNVVVQVTVVGCGAGKVTKLMQKRKSTKIAR